MRKDVRRRRPNFCPSVGRFTSASLLDRLTTFATPNFEALGEDVMQENRQPQPQSVANRARYDAAGSGEVKRQQAVAASADAALYGAALTTMVVLALLASAPRMIW